MNEQPPSIAQQAMDYPNQQSNIPASQVHEKAGGMLNGFIGGATTIFQWVVYIGAWLIGISGIAYASIFIFCFFYRPEYKASDFIHPDGMNEAQATRFVETINVCKVVTHAPGICSDIKKQDSGISKITANYSHVDVPPRGNG